MIRGSEVLGAQIVLYQAGYYGPYGHKLRGERLIIITLVKLRWILQVYFEDKTFLILVCHPMIKYAKVEDGNAAICVNYKQFYFTALVLANLLEFAIWNFYRHGSAV